MFEQPSFGRRLRQLRTERSLSQTDLAGDGMSTGYLSRLESGARRPSERAVAHLAAQLGIGPEEFEKTQTTSLAQCLSIATSLDTHETRQRLAQALECAHGQDPMLRWQALWLLSQWKRRHGEHSAERAFLDELVALSEEIGLPELRCRALAQLARSHRTAGEITPAVDAATAAHRLAHDGGLSPEDRAAALVVLVSVEAEAGRLPDAHHHADELTRLVEGRHDALWAEAMWTAVAVRVRQGDFSSAQQQLEHALERFNGRENPKLWLRLRLIAADLQLQKSPPGTDAAQRYIETAQTGLPFAWTPAIEQELDALKTHLAFHEGRFADARAMLNRLGRSERRMSYRNRIRLDVLDNQLRILEGDEDEGMAGLQQLALQAQESSNIDLAATIWRLAAESLLKSRSAHKATSSAD
ncbi:helix-turn-helix domain-containing protein [Streptomyces cahuitamycinicus]|uniref:Transcriptional regulator n=1 Tax=Streptomyces cahuitamycinicus TaxID=2070367 RepID=A0A2N8TXT7_9ACTN|nr:helix-turn-helix domain-containing protein [Streptomyces cahuitamycinicus]PNG23827.1 transcriptional regulator [Streptomyces cahuitamycinicus]